ncbi:tRNA lysidine(34) synthetase TilS [Penaeicola halotolerans]|uniref:tRNA lysidine(34) synthetase TilS n=1 Tax=Penaeicola halotolerans TaxID=2793196 RepID=UPI001CF8E2E4|nr:tRNA lysidine(34) synthetase TilS [Penaeicola halotolerans]
MHERFLRYVREKQLFDAEDRLLLAVSGGIDSVVLAHLLHRSGFQCELAHVNFQLRGEDSEQDMQFVQSLADQFGWKLHVHRADTKDYAQSRQISTQMAAREIRYGWFEELSQKFGLKYILTAHHAGDQLETIMGNLIRGTGVEGLSGILEKRANLVRPLLSFSREEIEAYAAEQGIAWREDKSNQEVKYKRNYIRHELLPAIEKLNPNYETTLAQTFARIAASGAYFLAHVERLRQNYFLTSTFDLKILESELHPVLVLHYLLKPFGFNESICEDIWMSYLAETSGKQFKGESQIAWLDRGLLQLNDSISDEFECTLLEGDGRIEISNQSIEWQIVNTWKLTTDRFSAILDADKLVWPLVWRTWRHGDRFQPLGMRQAKKISDLLIDLKIPLVDKKAVTVLLSGEEIVWVVGLRISERFKVSESTTRAINFKWRKD